MKTTPMATQMADTTHTIDTLQRLTPEELAKWKAEWLANLPPARRAKIKAAETRQKQREKITSTVISILVLRCGLRDPRPEWVSEADHRQHTARRQQDLAAEQIKLERWAIKHFRLDHLKGVEEIYGIKQRQPRQPRKP